jgi:hypothetical protein
VYLQRKTGVTTGMGPGTSLLFLELRSKEDPTSRLWPSGVPEQVKDVHEWDRSSGARPPRAQSSLMDLERRVEVGFVAMNGSGWKCCGC